MTEKEKSHSGRHKQRKTSGRSKTRLGDADHFDSNRSDGPDSATPGPVLSEAASHRSGRDRDAKERAGHSRSDQHSSTPGELREAASRSRKLRNGARATKPGAIGENANKNSSAKNKETSGERATKPGVVNSGSDSSRKKDQSSIRSTLPGATPENATTRRHQRKADRAAASANLPTAPASTVRQDGFVLEAVTVNDNSEGTEIQQMRREFEEKEKIRQKEIEELNQRLADKKAQDDANAANEEERKKRRKRIIVAVVCVLLLIVAGVVTYFGLNRDTDTSTEEAVPDTATSGGTNTTNSSVPSNLPTDLPSSSPSEFVFRYDPPSEEDCSAVANGETPGGDALIQRNFLLPMDVVMSADKDEDETAQELKESIQTLLMPELLGCPSASAANRKLQTGVPLVANYVITNAIVDVQPSGSCGRTEATPCQGVLVSIGLRLEGLERILTLMEMINVVFGYDQELVQKLNLADPYVEIILLTIDSLTISEAPSMIPSMEPSGAGQRTQAPSVISSTIMPSPSLKPTLAPVSGSTPPPSARPTTVSSVTPSL
ncbi:MAG: hypothetical protein SGBAC_007634 [Bacillariaceae sp.]